jgi:hypothetical protein
MRDQVNVLGWLFIAFGAIMILMAVCIFLVLAGSGAASGDHTAFFITGTVGTAILIFVTALALPNLITGWGLLKFRPWARILALILGALHVFAFPFGTLLCVYTFYVLLKDETVRLFQYGY